MGSRKINIAIFISHNLQSGGGFQYEYMVLDILKKFHKNNRITFKYYSIKDSIKNDFHDLNLTVKTLKENVFNKVHRVILSNIFLFRVLKKFKLGFSRIEKELLKDEIDLIYFLSPNLLSQGISNIPYIFTLWDLGHLDGLEFPEVSYDRQFEVREYLYTKSLKKAFKVIVDLEYSKKNTIKKYNLDEKRIEVLKFLPNIRVLKKNIFIDIKKKYKLKNDYIFYPAQFWAHKNHVYILKAIKILREEKKIDVDVIFSGSDQGNLNYILETSKEYKIDDLVHYIGFVTNEEMPHLYEQSLSLVMPTYLGPTNIPPLEAFAYETPVCYSDTPFFREQVGNAAFFMNLNHPNSLVDILTEIKENKALVKEKIIKGTKILYNWTEYDFYKKLLNIFNEFKYIRELWG